MEDRTVRVWPLNKLQKSSTSAAHVFGRQSIGPTTFWKIASTSNKQNRTRRSSWCCRHHGDWSGQHPRLGRQTDSSSFPAAAGASVQSSHVRSLIHLPGHHWINVLRPVAWTHTVYHIYNYIYWTVVVRVRCGGAEDAWLFLITW